MGENLQEQIKSAVKVGRIGKARGFAMVGWRTMMVKSMCKSDRPLTAEHSCNTVTVRIQGKELHDSILMSDCRTQQGRAVRPDERPRPFREPQVEPDKAMQTKEPSQVGDITG